ncbi:MAG: peptidase [Frankiales bacterium]|nr:peptidase [Frankiales bacterium]
MEHALDAVTPARLVGLVGDLVRIPSVTGTPAESDAQHDMARRMDAMGLETDLWPLDLPALTSDPAFPGMEAPRSEGWGLVGACGDGDGPTLVLNGHIDVVPTGDASVWTRKPFSGTALADRVVGRGTCDMKGGLACQLLAAAVLQEAGVDLHGRLLLQSVVGEEDGGLGTFATLARGHRGDLAVVCEPTSLALVPACAGALTFRLRVVGLAAHASVRDRGVDAMDKYVLVHQALRRLEASRNISAHPLMTRYAIPYPLSVGTVRAGDWPSSVPDLLLAEGRIGVALGEDPADARRALEDCLAEVSAEDPWLAKHPVTVDWYGGQFAPGELPQESRLLEVVASAHATVVGAAPQVYGVPYGSDLRLLTAGGVPTVQYGPGDVNAAHAPDEFVPIDELVTVTRTLVLLAATVLAGRS